jgi:SAM-dependent methyltransferase/putative flippase GtrA
MSVVAGKAPRPIGRFLRRVIRYGIVGTIVSIVYSIVVVALIDGLHVRDAAAASVVAFVLVLPFGYLAHRRVTFFDADADPFAPLRYIVTTSASFVISVGGMYAIADLLGKSYLYGIALNWATIPAMNFLIYCLWVFRVGNGPPRPAIDAGSPDRFGYSWDVYAELLPEHEEQFRRWTAPLTPEQWRGVRFLDGGCGIGRNAYWPMIYGAAGGLAIDVDDRTLARARENLAAFPAVEVRRESIYEIAEENAFDLAFSIGVIHHLEFPGAAVARLARATRPGGTVLVWLYGRENNGWIVRLLNPVRMAVLSRLPLGLVHALSWPLAAILWLSLRLGAGRLEYFRLLRKFAFRHVRAIVFDHLIPRIARYYTRGEAIELLRQAGLDAVDAVWVNQMSWAVRGRKPL